MSGVKGLLKGLRYISQIFENEKEQEFEIGMPTDVKHVAHIGNEGANASNPSWMNEYQGEASSGQQNCNGNQTTKSSAKESTSRSIELNSPSESPSRPSSGKSKQSKRNTPTSPANSMGSPARDPNSKPRRNKNTGPGSESPSRDPNVAPKPGRKKKTKGALTGEVSMRSRQRTPEPQAQGYGYSDPGPGYDRDSGSDLCQKSILDKYDDGKDSEELSRRIRAL